MAFITQNIFPNISRHSNGARSAAELANAITAVTLSHAKTAAGVATATVTSQVKTVNTLTYTINGVFKSKAGTDNFWTLAGATVAVSSWQKYLLLIDAAGAASIQEATQSRISALAVMWPNVASTSIFAPILTAISNTKAIVGVLTVATDATHTFIPGTTLLGATGITATYIDGIDQSLLPVIANQQGTVVGIGG